MARVVADAPEVEKHVNCRGCAKRIAYVGNDVHKREGTDYGGGPDGREWIVCPNCGKQITIRSW